MNDSDITIKRGTIKKSEEEKRVILKVSEDIKAESNDNELLQNTNPGMHDYLYGQQQKENEKNNRRR